MGVEPTQDVCSTPLNNFEDCGAHRDSSTPTEIVARKGHAVKCEARPLSFFPRRPRPAAPCRRLASWSKDSFGQLVEALRHKWRS